MSLFAPCAGPRVFALPPGADFCAALVAGLETRLAGQPPEAMARIDLWVNTQRAKRGLIAAFAAGPARLLPRIRVVTELAADPLAPLPAASPAAAAPVSMLGRRLDLARLVAALLHHAPDLASGTAAFDLADSLADLLDEMQGEAIDPADLERLDAGDHAAHWQRSLTFLRLLRGYVATSGPVEAQGRMRVVADALADVWRQEPPSHPVIVAGSTGSRGATRAFMAAVARLPQGALVLPGFDADLPAPVWDRLGATDAGAADHPQGAFRRLADAIGLAPGAVEPWLHVPPPAPERNRLVSLALRPAPVTDQWATEGKALAGTLTQALAAVTWIEADGPRAEARAIAWLLREAAETGTRAALITPDRELARRVTAELSRWGLRPDDSAGRPLALTPPGVLLTLLADVIAAPLTPARLLALLKHPLTASAPEARAPHRRLTGQLETGCLRGGPPEIAWGVLRDWAAGAGGAAPAWIAWIEATLAPLARAAPAPLDAVLARHRAAAEALAGGPETAPGIVTETGAEGATHGLWDKDAGLAARALLDALAADGAAFGPITAAEYRALLANLMAGRDVPEEAVVTHPGIAIWGTLEARVQRPDLAILGGLNEGIWPRLPPPDPWLSRGLRRDLGLPSPDNRIGLSAHDFQQATAAPRVVLTRAIRDAEAPTVPSRWLLRLENLLGGLGAEGQAALDAARARGRAALARAVLLDRPEAPLPPAARPAPRPPAHARPAKLSVTQIETLVRDPYAIYARHVLGLKPLEPLGRAPDAMARGSALHAALEAFLAETEAGLPDDAAAVLTRVTDAALRAAAPWPAIRLLWSARLARSAAWFLDGERLRRARGAPVARERRGARALERTPMPFTVTAKADRIDRMPDGAYALYDYKSGAVPSVKEAAAFHLQLPLEGAIAAAGGFEGLAPAPTRHMELIGLGARQSRVIEADPAVVWERLHRLIAAYQAMPGPGFVARLRPQRLIYASDYDHLARYGEWADTDRPVPEDVG